MHIAYAIVMDMADAIYLLIGYPIIMYMGLYTYIIEDPIIIYMGPPISI